jgi:hypothetical protein
MQPATAGPDILKDCHNPVITLLLWRCPAWCFSRVVLQVRPSLNQIRLATLQCVIFWRMTVMLIIMLTSALQPYSMFCY